MGKEHVRNFAKLFTNLTDGQRREMERALAELDNQQEITNLVTSLEFIRRKPVQAVPIPEITSTPIVKGAILEWQSLADQRISIYEIHVSNDPNFANFTTTSTFGNSAVLEGLTLTTFVRVRGVRSDGSQGPFSETEVITPFVFSIKARTQETFYFPLLDNTEYTILGGGNTEFEYQPINEEGFSMTWGNLSVYGNPEIEVLGEPGFIIRMISRVVETGATTEHARVTPTGYWGTYQLGPVCIPHPETQQTLQVSVIAQDVSMKARSFYPSIVLYGHLNSFELGTNTTVEGMPLLEELPSGNPP